VAFPLHQHTAAALREEAERQMVGERPAGQEDGGFFTEHCRHPLFESSDDAVPRELVRSDPVILRKSRQQARIPYRRQRQAI
jgi:hypothetical protein